MLTISSCQKTKVTETLTPQTSKRETSNLTLRDIKVEEGMLKFENEEHLTNCRNELSTMTQDQIIDWQKSIGFVSCMSKINEAQEEIRLSLERNPESGEEINSYNRYKDEISQIANKYSDYLTLDENGNITHINYFDPSTAWLTNLEKMLICENNIFHFDDKNFIQLKEVNVQRMKSIISNPIAQSGVFISKIVSLEYKKSRGSFSNSSISISGINVKLADLGQEVPNQNGNQRRITSFRFYLKGYTSASGSITLPVNLNWNLYYEGYNQKRTTFAGWQPTYITTNINGTYNTPTFGAATINYYGNTTPYSISMPGVYYFTNTLGAASKGVGSSVLNVSYSFNASFTCKSFHNNNSNSTITLSF